MSIRSTLAIVVTIVGIGSASAGIRVGEGARLNDEVIACPTLSLLVSLQGMMRKDAWQAATFARTNGCKIVKKGERVRVGRLEDRVACFLIPDDPTGCFYTDIEKLDEAN